MKCFLVLTLLAAAFMSGCNNTPEPMAVTKVGQRCAVQFRRDALGAAAQNPIPPETDASNGAEVTIVGTLKRVQADGVLIDTGRFEYIIPMHSILSLRFDLPAQATTTTQAPKSQP